MTTHLEAIGLEKAYRKGKCLVPVLTGVDLAVEHGELLAVVNASAVTEVRTAAVSGVVTEALAREDAGDLAVIGGEQSGFHGSYFLTASWTISS